MSNKDSGMPDPTPPSASTPTTGNAETPDAAQSAPNSPNSSQAEILSTKTTNVGGMGAPNTPDVYAANTQLIRTRWSSQGLHHSSINQLHSSTKSPFSSHFL